MPRGGRRKGAGRKKLLDYVSRLAIGWRCEQLWREAWEAKANKTKKTLDAEMPKTRLEWVKAHAIPVAERAAWLKGAGAWHWENVYLALCEDQEGDTYDPRQPARRLIYLVKRPKGVRKDIMKRVAAEETAKRGITITPRMVETCWKELRRHNRKLEIDDEWKPPT